MKNLFIISVILATISGCNNLTNYNNITKSAANKELVQNTLKLPNISDIRNKAIKIQFKDNNYYHLYYGSDKIIAEPVIENNIVYSINQLGFINAFSLKTEKTIWSTNVNISSPDKKIKEFFSGGILVHNDKLYVSCGTKDLIIIDTKTGYELLRKKFDDIIYTKPVILDNNILIIQTINNQITFFDINNFKVLARYYGQYSDIGFISLQGDFSPIIHDNHVIISYSSGEILCLDLKCNQKWIAHVHSDFNKKSMLDISSLITKPVFINEYGYFATSNKKIIKINYKTGEIKWQKVFENEIQSISVYNDDLLFATNSANQIIAISTDKGEVTWQANLHENKKNNKFYFYNAAYYHQPFFTQENNQLVLNILSSKGYLFQFKADENNALSSLNKEVNKITRNHIAYQTINYQLGILYLFTPSLLMVF